MRVFCDTSVIVAGFLQAHPDHHKARPVLERVKAGVDEGFVAAHSLAEVYAVLTRLPGGHYVVPGMAWQLLHENIIKAFSIIPLGAKEYAKAIRGASESAVEGGRTYDALLLAAAAKCGVDRIYTFNLRHFHSLAKDELKSKIVSP
jgi:predicted nucleic acid-binding protein